VECLRGGDDAGAIVLMSSLYLGEGELPFFAMPVLDFDRASANFVFHVEVVPDALLAVTEV